MRQLLQCCDDLVESVFSDCFPHHAGRPTGRTGSGFKRSSGNGLINNPGPRETHVRVLIRSNLYQNNPRRVRSWLYCFLFGPTTSLAVPTLNMVLLMKVARSFRVVWEHLPLILSNMSDFGRTCGVYLNLKHDACCEYCGQSRHFFVGYLQHFLAQNLRSTWFRVH